MPLIELALLIDRKFLCGSAVVFAFPFSCLSCCLAIRLYRQNQLDFPPMRSGLAMLSLVLGLTISL